MRVRARLVVSSLVVLLAACATAPQSADTSAERSHRIPSGPPRNDSPEDERSILAYSPDEVPAAVRAIEKQIDRRAVLIAEEIRIEVSRNYEWDVSLVGDAVSPQRVEGSGQSSEAVGSARATLRNLDLRASQKITFWKSGFDVTPFIRVAAQGNVSYVEVPENGGEPIVRRARLCTIRNETIKFDAGLLDVIR